jgi:hypothetical protein
MTRELGLAKAEKLIEWVWVSRDLESSNLVVEHSPPSDSAVSVPAIRVFRDGSFEIPSSIRDYLDYHPVLAIPGKEAPADGDDRPLILQALDEVDVIEEEIGLGNLGLFHAASLVPEDAGKDRRIVDAGYAAHQLRLLLNPEFHEDETDEGLEWLGVGKERTRFWRLLDSAFLFGEIMERHRLLDQRRAEEAMLRMTTNPPGKQGRLSEAILKMIKLYAVEKKSLPNSTQLLHWLGGKRPQSNGDPLEVAHPLWTDPVKKVSWERLQDLVKQAKRKLSH